VAFTQEQCHFLADKLLKWLEPPTSTINKNYLLEVIIQREALTSGRNECLLRTSIRLTELTFPDAVNGHGSSGTKRHRWCLQKTILIILPMIQATGQDLMMPIYRK
jgi:hypothetical protein